MLDPRFKGLNPFVPFCNHKTVQSEALKYIRDTFETSETEPEQLFQHHSTSEASPNKKVKVSAFQQYMAQVYPELAFVVTNFITLVIIFVSFTYIYYLEPFKTSANRLPLIYPCRMEWLFEDPAPRSWIQPLGMVEKNEYTVSHSFQSSTPLVSCPCFFSTIGACIQRFGTNMCWQ